MLSPRGKTVSFTILLLGDRDSVSAVSTNDFVALFLYPSEITFLIFQRPYNNDGSQSGGASVSISTFICRSFCKTMNLQCQHCLLFWGTPTSLPGFQSSIESLVFNCLQLSSEGMILLVLSTFSELLLENFCNCIWTGVGLYRSCEWAPLVKKATQEGPVVMKVCLFLTEKEKFLTLALWFSFSVSALCLVPAAEWPGLASS